MSLLFAFPTNCSGVFRKGCELAAFSIRFFDTCAAQPRFFHSQHFLSSKHRHHMCFDIKNSVRYLLRDNFRRLQSNLLFVARLEHVLLFFCGSVTGFEDLRYSSPAFKSAYQLMKHALQASSPPLKPHNYNHSSFSGSHKVAACRHSHCFLTFPSCTTSSTDISQLRLESVQISVAARQ